MNLPQLAVGTVRHTRLRPVRHAFAYPTLFMLLPMRSLHAMAPGEKTFAHNRRGLFSFHDRDHGDGRDNAVQWLDALLAKEGVTDADGEAWLHCFPRVLGYAFKPVSFWYCHRRDGSLRAIVAEVNNTFGERHIYLLDTAAWGHELRARKQFHVSPFCTVEGGYRFRFMWTGERIVARIDHDTDEGPLLQTSVSGTLRPATRGAVRGALLRFPFLTMGIIARIHWQALRLWLARVPFHSQPAAGTADGEPRLQVTR